MQDEAKTKKQLISELHELRLRVVELEEDRRTSIGQRKSVMAEEDFTKAALDSLPGIFYFLDEQGRFLRWNRELERASGYSAEEIRRMSPLDFFNEPDKRIIAERIDEVFRTGEAFVEAELVSKNQTKTPFYFTGKLFWFEKKRCMLGMGLDITKRKRTEEALLESENKFLSFAEQAITGITIIQDGVYKYVNPRFAQMFGYTVDQCLNDLPFRNLVYEEDVALVEEQVRRRISGEIKSAQYTFRGLKKNGQIFNAEIYGAAIIYQGKPAALATILDISERKRAEEALRESEERLKIAMDLAKLVHWEYDVETGLYSFDEQFYAFYGTTAELEGGAYMTAEAYAGKFIPPDESYVVAEAIAKTLATTDPNFTDQLEHRIIRTDGEERNIIVRWSVACDHMGKVVKIRGANQDISERKRAEQELRQIPSKLISLLEEERKRLASELHDSIGQTLAALKYRAEYITTIFKRRRVKEAVHVFDEFVSTLQRAIDETRSIYMGLRPKILEDFGAVAALMWYRDELIKLDPYRHIEMDIGIEEDEIPDYLIIPIFRIAQEALNNVYKHSSAEWVDVFLSRDGNAIKLIVSDDGLGMDLQYILQSCTAKSLGLVGMRERAELTGGRFSIESTLGEGTTVRVLWPIRHCGSLEKYV